MEDIHAKYIVGVDVAEDSSHGAIVVYNLKDGIVEYCKEVKSNKQYKAEIKKLAKHYKNVWIVKEGGSLFRIKRVSLWNRILSWFKAKLK